MKEDVAIKVDGVYKDFKLPHEKVSSIKGLFTGMFRRKTGGYEMQHALKDISFEVKKGEFFGIVGRNGSGKSTLLKILAGIYQPTKGSVTTLGKVVPFIELGVGFNPELTGRENVYLNGAMLGFSETEITQMYDSIVEFAELERFMDQKLKNYSSGMQVRLAFSMAIRAQADILLVDEVLAVGDADFQRKCFSYFKELKRNKKTVIFVSHDMEAIREYCDKCILIDNSQLVLSGNSSKIAEQYLQLFNEDSPRNGYKKKKLNSQRWGTQTIVTKKLGISVNNNEITISQDIVAKDSILSPIIGFRIRAIDGKEIMGTNTKVERLDTPKFQKGNDIRLVWSFPNILSDGEYWVEPAILYNDGITVADWWNEAAQVVIKKERHLPYSIDPGIVVDIKLQNRSNDRP